MATYEELLEQLYDLDRIELRWLAYEALLICDGPDKVSGELGDETIQVVYYAPGEAFFIQPSQPSAEAS